ncbi:FUSC family protein [Cellulosimicrobium sp. Marseille-Q4280]|uniref:FUSC family protein n=1 Tax=Cellulosimicrobium sp. Marseille-Q4280 TaxID=2937992 RepID=UPI002041A1AC|nr:FUSC family protein [Cellulosimicrobium sp. Marseille-Q4280]
MPLSLAPVRSTARTVLDPSHLSAALRASPADATVAAALRCGAAVALALAVPGLLGRTDLAAFASLGALTSLYGRYDPYRRRASLLAGVGVVMTASIALFTALAALAVPPAVLLAGVAALAAGSTALCALLRTGPPGATIVVFAAGAGLAGAPGLEDVGPRAVAAALGALLAWVVCTAGAVVRPSGPARLAVRRALDATRAAAASSDATAGPASDAAAGPGSDAARRAVARAREVLADDLSWRLPRAAALELSAELDLVERTLGTSGAGVRDAPVERRTTLRDQARRNLSGRWRLPTARVAVAGVVAGGVASLAGLGHAAWATMGSTAVLQGDSDRNAVVRALQRGAGTVVGALLAWPLLAAHLGFWATAAVVVVLQTVTEVVVGRHYGLAMLTITPMALLMTSLAHPAEPASLALDRALDTVVGAAVGLLAVVLLHARPTASDPGSDDPGPTGEVPVAAGSSPAGPGLAPSAVRPRSTPASPSRAQRRATARSA